MIGRRSLGVVLALLAPALLYLARLPAFPTLPHNDYYVILSDLLDGEHLSHDPVRWLTVRSNEHRVTIPCLLYAANIALTRGHNWVLSAIALASMAAVAASLYRLLPADLRRAPAALAFAVPIGLFAFTPVAAHNVFLGFSGTMWLLSNAFAIGAMALLVHGQERESVAGPIALGALGAFTYSTNYSLWPCLVAGALLLPGRRRRALVLAVAAAVVLFVAVSGYHKPEYHPDPVKSPRPLLQFLGAYLGSPLALEAGTARILGWLGLAWAAGLGVVTLKADGERRRDLVPWAMVALFALGNGMGTAVGRAGFSIGMALSPRYATLPSMFWVSLFVATGLLAWRWRPEQAGRRRAAIAGLASLFVVATIGHERRGAVEIDKEVLKARGQKVAAAAFVYQVADRDLLAPVTLWPEHVPLIAGYLARIGHRPFAGAPLFPAPTPIDPSLVAPADDKLVSGRFEALRVPSASAAQAARLVRIEGWAKPVASDLAELAVVDGQGVRQPALFVYGVDSDGISRRHPTGVRTRWSGLLQIDCRTESLALWGRLEGERLFRPLSTAGEVRAAYALARAAACVGVALPPVVQAPVVQVPVAEPVAP